MSNQRARDIDREGAERHNAPPAADVRTPGQRLAGALGNRGLGRVVARMRDGEGILPGGVAHPDVEAAIRSSRGRGHPLPDGLRSTLEHRLGDSLHDVRVHTDEQSVALARAVSARAFTVGSDIYFSHGEYRPHAGEGASLIMHEVAHVVQQRGAPPIGPLQVSQPGDPAELEAEAVAREYAP